MLKLVLTRCHKFGTTPLQIFQSRDLLYQHTSELLGDAGFVAKEKAKLTQPRVLSVYCGYDPTAESLHLGNLVSIIMMARLHKLLGFRPIFLLGGATGLIGDPSGKKVQRDLLAEARVNSNLQFIKNEIQGVYGRISKDLEQNYAEYGLTLLDAQQEAIKPVYINNYEFYKEMSVLTYLREIGKVLKMGNLLSKQIIANRLQSETGLSYTQFSYSILQSYDFYRLNRDYGCVLQFGGSDQWGNITNGCDLTKRLSRGELQGYGITMPLLVTKTGQKFGKSEGNALFLNSNKTPTSQIYDYFYSTADDQIQKLLKIFTLYSPAKIQEIMSEQKNAPEKRPAQKLLAQKVSAWLGSYTNLKEELIKTTDVQLKKKTAQELEQIYDSLAPDMKSTISESEFFSKFKFLPDIFVQFGLCKSKNEARNDIAGDGAYINNSKVPKHLASAPVAQIYNSCKLEGNFMLFRKGKKKYLLLRIRP